jgi:Mg2+ and Co2+ transporter CorA
MSVMEEIAIRIGQFDEQLMSDRQSRTLTTLHSIYHLKHDLLHLRILFNPLKEIITRLQRETSDDHYLLFPRTDPSIRLGMKHFIIRRQLKTNRQTTNDDNQTMKLRSIYLNDYIYFYLNDLNNHIDQLIDSLEIQRESVSILISFWITLNNNEIQEILKFLMLITVLFMPCVLLSGLNSTNFDTQPQLVFHYSYFIMLAVVGLILSGMITCYKTKKWV